MTRRTGHRMRMPLGRGTSLALAGLIAVLVTGVAGCGGGDGALPLVITITGCDASSFAPQGVVCVEFFVNGIYPGSPYGLLAQFAAGPGAPLEIATPVPPALAGQLGVESTSGPLTRTKSPTPFRFCWYAGADLGFLATPGIQFFLTPVDPGTGNPIGPPASCGPIDYPGGGHTETASGPALAGRAGHCGAHVHGRSIAVAGGFGPSNTVHDTIERLTFDSGGSSFTHNSAPLLMQSPRTNQACSFFLDPATGTIKILVTGGDTALPPTGPTATADVYCFTPIEQIMPASGAMNVARRHHTATWIPSNEVVIIGGSGATGPLCSIEIWDPVTGLFQLQTTTLAFCREEHTATLLPSGKILVAGGHDPSAGSALPAELFDPKTGSVMTVPGPLVDRVRHTATRLANGWVLLAGGFLASDTTAVTSSAQIFEPELGPMGAFTSIAPMMNWPRAQHAASLLGDGHALLTGGRISGLGCPVVTPTAELFLPETLVFTPTVQMAAPREQHTSTATSDGFIAVVGGTNDPNCVQDFLSSVEIYPFENRNPVILNATDLPPPGQGGSIPAGTSFISVTVSDADADGGYLIIRYRVGGTGLFRLATITQQVPSTAPLDHPNMHVTGLPGQGTTYAFLWQWFGPGGDGLTAGQSVEIEVLPVGATLGDPVRFTTLLQ